MGSPWPSPALALTAGSREQSLTWVTAVPLCQLCLPQAKGQLSQSMFRGLRASPARLLSSSSRGRPWPQRSAGSESSGSQCGVLAPETCVKVGSPHGQGGGGRRVHRAGGQTPSSSPALSPSPQPPPSSCGLPHSTPSLCRATHFPPGDTGDRSPGLRLLHQLDVM